MRPSTPTSPARSSSTCARIDQVFVSTTLRPMPSSRTSMTLSSSSSSTTDNTVPSSSGPSRLSPPRGRHDDHRDRPASSQPGSSQSGATRRPISSPTTASLSQNSNPRIRRRRRNSGAGNSAISQDLLLHLVTALASILPPSTALFDVLRRQVSTVSRALTTEEIDVCNAPAKWWCPCCRRIHKNANCTLLKAHNPCNSCGAGHSHRSCPQLDERHKVECAPSPKFEERRPPAVRLPPSLVSDTVSAIKFGDLWSDEPLNEALTQQQTLPATDDFVAPTTEPSSPHCNEEQGSVHTPTAVPMTAVHHGDLQCTPLYKSTESKSEVTHGKRTEYGTCASPECQERGGGLSTSTAEGSISAGDSAPISKEASTQTSLPSCGVAVQCNPTDAPAVLDSVPSRFPAHGPRAPARAVSYRNLFHRAAGPLRQPSPMPPAGSLVARPGCCSACQQPLVDGCHTATDGTHEMLHHPWATSKITICEVCFRGNLNYQAYFQWYYSLVTQKYVNRRNRYVICIDGATADDSPRLIRLPASWTPLNALTTVAGHHEQYYMEFLKQYGAHLICAAVARSPFDRILQLMQVTEMLTFDQVAKLDDIHQFNKDQNALLTQLLNGASEHNRGWLAKGHEIPAQRVARQLTSSAWNIICSAAVAAGLTSYSTESYWYPVPDKNGCYGSKSTAELRHLQCPQCRFTVEPCVQYSKHFGDPTFLTRTLVHDHLIHNPNCQYFDFHKEMCTLPEIFRPECSVQALLPEYDDRKQAFMQQLTEAGYMGFRQKSPVAERDSAPVFNYWTGSYFRCDTWQALVPACTFEPA